jgi:hypothetical protein
MEPRLLSDYLRWLRESRAREHPLEFYADAFAGFDRRVVRFLGAGAESLVVHLEDGTVMHISQTPLPVHIGSSTRPFDAPVLESGSRKHGPFVAYYFMQPEGLPATEADVVPFMRRIHAAGYRWLDPKADNIKFFPELNEHRLVDPYSVRWFPPRPLQAQDPA